MFISFSLGNMNSFFLCNDTDFGKVRTCKAVKNGHGLWNISIKKVT